MADFRQTRSPVATWREILVQTYDQLLKSGAGDVWVFGSQAMSLYMKRPLTSKDLDLLVSGVTMKMVEKLCNSLASLSPQRHPYFNFQNFEYEGRPYPVFSIYLVPEDRKPFVVELFQTFLGYDLQRLTPYASNVKRWNSEFLTLCIEAIVGTRLAFRPPQRISRLNAERLNLFIKLLRKRIDWRKVEEFIDDFQLEGQIQENLRDLGRRKISILDSNKLSFLQRN